MTKWALAFSSMDDPESGQGLGEVEYEGGGEEGGGECELGEAVSVLGR